MFKNKKKINRRRLDGIISPSNLKYDYKYEKSSI